MLEQLANNSKVWVFQSDKALTDTELTYLKTQMDEFIPQWAAHGKDLNAAYQWQAPYFLLVGVDESKTLASGCSKDALTHKIQEIGAALKVDFFNRMNVAYELNGLVEMSSLADFKAKVQKDEIRQNTLVYNNLIETKAELNQKWRVPLKESWHAQLVKIV